MSKVFGRLSLEEGGSLQLFIRVENQETFCDNCPIADRPQDLLLQAQNVFLNGQSAVGETWVQFQAARMALLSARGHSDPCPAKRLAIPETLFS